MQEKKVANLPSQLKRVYVNLFHIYSEVASLSEFKANIKTSKPSWLRKMKKKNFRAGRWPFIGPSGAWQLLVKKKKCVHLEKIKTNGWEL